MSWIFFAILSLLSFTLYDLLSRVGGVNAKNPRVFSIIYALLVSLLTVPLFLIEPLSPIDLSLGIFLLTAVTLGVWVIFNRYEYYAHKHVEAATLSILVKIAPVITFILSIIFLHETINLNKVVGLVLVLAANAIILYPETQGKFKLTKGLSYALIIVLTLGVGWTLDKVIAPIYGAVLYTIMTFGIPALINLLTPPVKIGVIRTELKNTHFMILFLAIFSVIGYTALIKSLTLGEASRVIPVATANTPLVVIMAAIFLKERKHLPQKFLATILTVFGIILLS